MIKFSEDTLPLYMLEYMLYKSTGHPPTLEPLQPFIETFYPVLHSAIILYCCRINIGYKTFFSFKLSKVEQKT